MGLARKKRTVETCGLDGFAFYRVATRWWRLVELALLDCLCWASCGAGAAAEALVLIDFVVALAFENCLNRTFSGAGAAGDAVITNLVSHNLLSF